MKCIHLHGPLTEDVAKRVVTQIQAAAGQPIDLRIDSPGGKFGAAIHITMEMEENGFVVTTVVGQASSAAGLVAMAGDRRRIVRGGLMFIHHPAPYCSNTSDEVAAAIAEYTGQPRSVAWKWMSEERTFGAIDAKAAGLVDGIASADLLPIVFIREPPKRRPTKWLRRWREDYERMDLR